MPSILLISLAAVVLAATAGLLLLLVRRIQRKSRVQTETAHTWSGRDYSCPQCNAPLQPGRVLCGKGILWSDRDGPPVRWHAHIGQALENTISLHLPPALNQAWRCPACRLVLIDHSRLLRRR